jgi:uncharacterized membrane protein
MLSSEEPPRWFSIGPFGAYVIFSGVGILVTAVAILLLNLYAEAASPKVVAGVIIAVVSATIIVDKWVFSWLPQKICLVAGLIGWFGTFLLLLLWTSR